MAEQLDIFGPRNTDVTHQPHRKCPDAKPSIDQRFADFHQANPHVFDEMLRLARARVAGGVTRLGAKALWEELRISLAKRDLAYDSDFKTFKLNNDFTAPMARMLIEHDPSLAAVIELRTRKAKTK